MMTFTQKILGKRVECAGPDEWSEMYHIQFKEFHLSFNVRIIYDWRSGAFGRPEYIHIGVLFCGLASETKFHVGRFVHLDELTLNMSILKNFFSSSLSEHLLTQIKHDE